MRPLPLVDRRSRFLLVQPLLFVGLLLLRRPYDLDRVIFNVLPVIVFSLSRALSKKDLYFTILPSLSPAIDNRYGDPGLLHGNADVTLDLRSVNGLTLTTIIFSGTYKRAF